MELIHIQAEEKIEKFEKASERKNEEC